MDENGVGGRSTLGMNRVQNDEASRQRRPISSEGQELNGLILGWLDPTKGFLAHYAMR